VGDAARIERLVSERRYEEALGLPFDAPRALVDREHMRLLHRFRTSPLVRQALNRAKGALVSESDCQRGRRLLAIGRVGEAVAALRRALERDGAASTHHDLGRALCRLSRPGEALSHFETAAWLRGDPDDLLWLGRTLDTLGRSGEALVHLERLVAVRGTPRDHHWIGVTLFGLGRTAEAASHLRLAASEGDPLDHELLRMCLDGGEPASAGGSLLDRVLALIRGDRSGR
jgi:tetratricopeptide (TPR) repeat protein